MMTATGPFREEAERRGRGREQQPAPRMALAIERRDKRGIDRERDEERQRQIGQRHARQREVAEVGRGDRTGQEAGDFVEPPPSARQR